METEDTIVEQVAVAPPRANAISAPTIPPAAFMNLHRRVERIELQLKDPKVLLAELELGLMQFKDENWDELEALLERSAARMSKTARAVRALRTSGDRAAPGRDKN